MKNLKHFENIVKRKSKLISKRRSINSKINSAINSAKGSVRGDSSYSRNRPNLEEIKEGRESIINFETTVQNTFLRKRNTMMNNTFDFKKGIRPITQNSSNDLSHVMGKVSTPHKSKEELHGSYQNSTSASAQNIVYLSTERHTMDKNRKISDDNINSSSYVNIHDPKVSHPNSKGKQEIILNTDLSLDTSKSSEGDGTANNGYHYLLDFSEIKSICDRIYEMALLVNPLFRFN